MGKGKDPNQEAREHVSAPLSTLKDPASFAPPPKHIHYHGAAAASPTSTSIPDSGGLGSGLPQGQSTAKQRLQERREAEARAEEEANRPPQGPYRVDTTGYSTAHLPKPPVRRADQETPPPAGNASARPPPKLPPRLPPRMNSHPDAYSQNPPPPYTENAQETASPTGLTSQGAMNRLGRAGVSVPGFNIDGTASPPVPARQSASPSETPSSPTAGVSRGPQLNELQSRFAKMSTPSQGTQAPSTGTSWADKQAALRTASNFRNDPSTVSVSDMRSAASTANNFRERHGEQAATGLRTASDLSQKYGIAQRAQGLASSAASPPQSPTQGAAGKKPPPPPPPKKKELTSNPGEPPPIPMGSKPKF